MVLGKILALYLKIRTIQLEEEKAIPFCEWWPITKEEIHDFGCREMCVGVSTSSLSITGIFLIGTKVLWSIAKNQTAATTMHLLLPKIKRDSWCKHVFPFFSLRCLWQMMALFPDPHPHCLLSFSSLHCHYTSNIGHFNDTIVIYSSASKTHVSFETCCISYYMPYLCILVCSILGT